MQESIWIIKWNWKMERCNIYLMSVLPRTWLPWKELPATQRHGFSQLILPKGFVLKSNFSFLIYSKGCHQVFWRSLPIQPLAIRLAILKKVQWSHGRTFEIGGNSFSSLLLLRSLLLSRCWCFKSCYFCSQKVQTQALVLPLYFSLSLR